MWYKYSIGEIKIESSNTISTVCTNENFGYLSCDGTVIYDDLLSGNVNVHSETGLTDQTRNNFAYVYISFVFVYIITITFVYIFALLTRLLIFVLRSVEYKDKEWYVIAIMYGFDKAKYNLNRIEIVNLELYIKRCEIYFLFPGVFILPLLCFPIFKVYFSLFFYYIRFGSLNALKDTIIKIFGFRVSRVWTTDELLERARYKVKFLSGYNLFSSDDEILDISKGMPSIMRKIERNSSRFLLETPEGSAILEDLAKGVDSVESFDLKLEKLINQCNLIQRQVIIFCILEDLDNYYAGCNDSIADFFNNTKFLTEIFQFLNGKIHSLHSNLSWINFKVPDQKFLIETLLKHFKKRDPRLDYIPEWGDNYPIARDIFIFLRNYYIENLEERANVLVKIASEFVGYGNSRYNPIFSISYLIDNKDINTSDMLHDDWFDLVLFNLIELVKAYMGGSLEENKDKFKSEGEIISVIKKNLYDLLNLEDKKLFEYLDNIMLKRICPALDIYLKKKLEKPLTQNIKSLISFFYRNKKFFIFFFHSFRLDKKIMNFFYPEYSCINKAGCLSFPYLDKIINKRFLAFKVLLDIVIKFIARHLYSFIYLLVKKNEKKIKNSFHSITIRVKKIIYSNYKIIYAKIFSKKKKN